MSRCFPFPPPGYEQKARTGITDLLTKEKQREKKHKKEKRDKEKREHKEKEKRGKDRSKDKHKEKKDQKPKDRKKENDKDKGRTSENIKAEGRTQGHNELHIKESWQKTDEGKDSKFKEELGKRTRDDGAENPIVGNFTNSIQREFDGVGAANASLEKERVAASRLFSVQVDSVQRRNYRIGLPIENASISLQRRVGCISTTAMEKERSKMLGFVSSATSMEKQSKMHEKVTADRSTEQSRNHGIARSMESVSGLVIRKTEGSTAGTEKEKSGERILVSNSVVPELERRKIGAKIMASSSLDATQRRKDVLGKSEENLSSIHGKTEAVGTPSLYSRIEGMDTSPTIGKERASGGERFPHPVSQAVEKDIHQKIERNNKIQENKTEDRKGHKDSVGVKRSKAKDKDRLPKEKKKEENIVENAEDIEHNKLRNFGKKDQVDTLNSKPLVPHKDNAIGIVCVDGTIKKRKDLDTNGYLQENDKRPDKIPRMTSSSQSIVSGRSFEVHLTAPSSISLKSGAINNLRPDRLFENNERKINGNAMSQQSPLEVKPPASGGLIEKFDVSLALPHPDSKYLSEIYTVPKMVELPEIDDQEWLFNCCDSLQKSKMEPKAEKIAQVFAVAMKIDSGDVLALPYVVPF